MKQREDELFGLAFGDIRGDAAERLRAELDVEDEKLVEELRGMKLDLQRMPVPPHQLSTERLRDAILNQGLQPKPITAPWWRLAWAPFAAAAIAVVGYQAMNSGKTAPDSTFVATKGSGTSVVAGPPKTIGLDAAIDPKIEFQPDHWFESSAPAPTIEHVRNSASSRSNRTQNANASRAMLASRNETRSTVGIESGVAALTTASQPAAMADATFDTVKKESSGGVILIGSETDSTTGANKAIEVQDSRDVLIGG